MAERTLTVRLRAVVDGYERAMESAGRATDRLADRADSMALRAGQATKLGGDMTRNLTLPLGLAGAGVVKFAGDFEASMREVQALTGATGSEMEMLAGQAKKMGADTQFSAGEAADAMSQLIRGGFDVRETYDALPGVMQLAAAATLDIASAADVATNVLSGFGMEVSDLSRVNDVLAQTANASDTDVRELGEAFKMVGPVARGAGMGFEETSAALALLAENGIRGTMAGTALRGIMGSLLAPSGAAAQSMEALGVSVLDAQGNLLPFVEIVRRFSDAGATTADIYKVFGRETAGAMQALIGSGAPALERFTGLLEDSGGVAQNLADAKMGGLTGSIEQLRGSLEGLAIEVGDRGGLSGFIEAVALGTTRLVNVMASAPAPLVKTAVAIAGIAAASGPAIWAAGKMAAMYRPVVSGIQSAIGWFQGLRVQMALAQAQGLSTSAALGAMFGPQAAVLIGVAALAALLWNASRAMDDFRARNIDAGSAAEDLARSAGIATREIGKMKDEIDRPAVTDDDFRRENDEALKTLREMDDLVSQQDFLVQIGYEFVLRTGNEEKALERVKKLAETSGVELPVTLTIDNIADFDNEVAGAIARAREVADHITEFGDVGARNGVPVKVLADLDAISTAAATAFNTQGPEAFARILAESEQALGGNAAAINYMVDTALVKLGDEMNVSTRNARTTSEALQELANAGTGTTDKQKELAAALLATARGMDGNIVANIAAAAAQKTNRLSASEYADAVAKAEKETGDFREEMEASSQQGGVFGSALESIARRAQLSALHIDAAASAAEMFSRSIEQSTTMDDQLSAGLQVGRALQSLRKGLSGEADEAARAKKQTDLTADAVSRLGDSLSRTDPKLAASAISLGGLAAAADAYRNSIDQSTGVDDQITAALSLGDAFTQFRRTVRRLPGDFDTVGASLGRYRKSQTTAVQNVAALGKATTDYLGTLIESGEGQDKVRGEAARLRGEYEAQMRQAGLTGDAIGRYLEVLGLTPKQVETALKVSGAEEARFRIQAYMQLLEGRIPAEVATGVVAQIEAGNLDAAAGALASWASTNPVQVPVEADDEVTGKDGAPLRWELPADFDPLVAAMGGYTEAQQLAIDGLMRLGDATTDYLGSLIGAGEPDKAREAADLLREAYRSQLEQLGLNEEQIDKYLEVLGLTPAQVETAIVVSGDEEARFKIETYSTLLTGEIPKDIETQVFVLMREDKLAEAADLLERWRLDQSGKTITIGAIVQPNAGLFGLLPSVTPATMQQGGGMFGIAPSVTPSPQGGRFVPGRAGGGPVNPGETYRVLEHGRAELFSPTIPGTITPLSHLMTPAAQARPSAPPAAQPGGLHLELGGVTVVSPRSEPTPEAIIRGVASKVWDETGLTLAGERR